MVQSEEEVLKAAQAILEQKQYQKLRNFIWSNHGLCQTDDIKLQLLRLWEESLYQEFISTRSHGVAGGEKAVVLSSSMRYKLRKKHPCPVELEHELRVKNARLPKTVHDGLNNWLKKHTENPYPNKVEKEGLAKRLNITPQQVNRWFIQRRKMLRIRGHLYLGRQYEHAKMKGELMDGEEEGDEDFDDYDDDSMEQYEADEQNNRPLRIDDSEDSRDSKYQNSSLLEKILTCPQVTSSQSRCSGGSVMAVARQSRHHDEDDELPLLTPPPSISGESIACRATPPQHHAYGHPAEWMVAGPSSASEQPLDLTKDATQQQHMFVAMPKSSPVILEPVTPPWKSAASSLSGASSMRSSPVAISSEHHFYPSAASDHDLMKQRPEDILLDYDERVAVNALLSLSKASARY